MKIGIVGLGLIGGSILKALSKRTDHECYAFNRTQSVLSQAQPYINGVLDENNMGKMDVIFVCLTPCVAMDYIINNADKFKKKCIIADVCGIKEYLVKNLENLLKKKNINFIGCHPMAGKEISGFSNATENLFDGASFIVTPTANSDIESVKTMEKLAFDIGFSKVTKTSPKEHDKIIAYTSQLAHVVSNAYTKSPTLSKQKGFSAGSFQDLTRVARLDSKMWTELFLLNKDNLLYELDLIIKNLTEYKTALEDLDKERLQILLERGNQLKLQSLKQ